MGCICSSILLTDNSQVKVLGYINDPDRNRYYPPVNLSGARDHNIIQFSLVTIDGYKFEVEHRQPFIEDVGNCTIEYTVDAQDQHRITINPRRRPDKKPQCRCASCHGPI
jgi:hypothetical protein